MTNETRGHLMVFYHRWSDGVTDQPLVTFTLRNHEGMEDVPFDKAKETTLKDMELCGLKVDKIERIDDWYYFPHVGSKDYADGWYEKLKLCRAKTTPSMPVKLWHSAIWRKPLSTAAT